MKKLISVLLAGGLLFTLASCDLFGKKDSDGKTAVVTDENGNAVTDEKGNVVTEQVPNETTATTEPEEDPNDDGKWSNLY